MPSIKKQNQDGSLLVRYRPQPSSPERTGTLPDFETYNAFKRIEHETRKCGLPCPSPAEFLATYTAPVDIIEPVSRMTLVEFIGNPLSGEPGRFFEVWDKDLSHARKKDYVSLVTETPVLARRPMRDITKADVKALIASWLLCYSCAEINEREGLGLVTQQLQCTGKRLPGCTRHHAARRRATLRKTLCTYKCAWDAAMKDVPSHVASNPFDLALPMFPEPDTGRPTARALTEMQLESLYLALPEHVAVIAMLGAFAFSRSNTLLALDIGHVKAHPDYPDAIVVHEAGKWNDEIDEIEHWQKGSKENGQRWLTGIAARRVREHIERFRNQPDHQVCSACRNGQRHWWGRPGNPHTGCDFADDAPLFVNSRGGKRLRHHSFHNIFKKACWDANLTKEHIGFNPVPHTLRATAVTLSHKSGNGIATIQKQGGWSDTRSISDSYLAHDESALVVAADATARRYEEMVTGDIDEDEDPAVKARRLQERISQLEDAQARSTAPSPSPRPRGLSTIPEAELRKAAEGARSKRHILDRLGLSGGSNFKRLEDRCAKFGIDLPAGRSAEV